MFQDTGIQDFSSTVEGDKLEMDDTLIDDWEAILEDDELLDMAVEQL